ncbi:hypothetical protein ETE55_00225 [Escherichia coli]|nr:hypothetical protein ETE55_00225 [Escherichia coli]
MPVASDNPVHYADAIRYNARTPLQGSLSELKYAVTEYIEYYNSRRISLKLKGLTPIEYRNQTYMPRV